MSMFTTSTERPNYVWLKTCIKGPQYRLRYITNIKIHQSDGKRKEECKGKKTVYEENLKHHGLGHLYRKVSLNLAKKRFLLYYTKQKVMTYFPFWKKSLRLNKYFIISFTESFIKASLSNSLVQKLGRLTGQLKFSISWDCS